MSFTHILKSKKIRFSAVFALFLVFISLQTVSKAQHTESKNLADTTFSSTVESDAHIAGVEHTEGEGEHEKFDPTAAIMEHIADSHYWHLWGHTSLPLPVIMTPVISMPLPARMRSRKTVLTM